ncbi:MAG: IS21 family transposase [Clostridia bacterium]|nr:IS21 family transposase [Clostridia bacterium]
MKVTLDGYRKIQQYKELGLSKVKTAEKIKISRDTVAKWWDISEDEFMHSSSTIFKYLDNYKEFFLEQIRTYPSIRSTNLYYKTEEAFPDFKCTRERFFSYIKKLRENYGFAVPTARKTTPRKAALPGEEAQVDFGQYKMKDMYGRIVRVYFFCMVLSYSRMRFVYFQTQPFTTETAIKAHEYAFRYFGGRTRTIMYDQDKVFVVSENYGNVIFVPEFEEYVKETGYSIVLCRPRDPQTKGKVEAMVGTVKYNFLEGRTYTGIDSLNSAALAWCDDVLNNRIHVATQKIPREAFKEEITELIKVPYKATAFNNIRMVQYDFSVEYRRCLYYIPQELVKVGDSVRVEEDDEKLVFRNPEDETVIYIAQKGTYRGERVLPDVGENEDSVNYNALKRRYKDSEIALEFLEKVAEKVTRYKNTHYRGMYTLSKVYTSNEMESAMAHCIQADNCTMHELAAYLIYRYGARKARYQMSKHMFYGCKQRAAQLQEELL